MTPLGISLAFDTSTPWGGLALLSGERLLGEIAQWRRRGHGDALVEQARDLLGEQGLALADVTLLVASVGPGGFTGVRLGVAVARALAWSTGAPVRGVCSLAALAFGALDRAEEASEASPVVACLDARKGQVYAGVFEMSAAGVPEALLPAGVWRPEALAERVGAEWPGARWVGDGLDAYPAALGAVPRSLSPLHHQGRPAHVALIGARVAAQRGAQAFAELVPVYLRASEAEENLGPPTGEVQLESR